MTFEPEGRPVRCPKCLRTHGVRRQGAPRGGDVPATGDSGTGAGGRMTATLGVLLFLAVAGAGAFVFVERRDGGAAPPEAVPSAVAAPALTDEARALLEAGDLKGAYRKADAAVRANARHAPARELLGDILLASRAQKEALAEYLAAVGLAERGELHVKAGNLFLALGAPAQAARHLARALELEPDAEWAPAVREALDKLAPPEGAPTQALPADAPPPPPEAP